MSALAKLLTSAAQARQERRFEDARNILVEAVELSRQSGEPTSLANALTGLGQIERDLHNPQPALAAYEEAAAIYRSSDDPLHLAHAVRHLGDICREIGQTQRAERYYEEALEIYRRQPETMPLDLANALRGMAILKQELGVAGAARVLWQEARKLYTASNVPAGVAESSRRLAQLEKGPE